MLGGDDVAAPGHHVPGEEALQGVAGLGLLLVGLPRRVEGERVPHRVQAFHQDGEVGGGAAGADLVGEGVHDVPEALRGGGGAPGLDLLVQEPLERAALQLFQAAAGQPHRQRGVAQRGGGGGGVVQAPPGLGAGGGDERAALLVGGEGEGGEPFGGGPAQLGRAGGVDGDRAQLGDQRGHGERAARPVGDVLDGDGRGAAQHPAGPGVDLLAVELAQEAGRLVAVVGGGLDGGDHQPVLGPGGGDVEEAAFLGEQRGGGEGFGEAVAADPVGLQQGAAAAQVGPEAVLDAA